MGVFVLIKPDAVVRGLAEEIEQHYNLELGTTPWSKFTVEGEEELLRKFKEHYIEHRHERFYRGLVRDMSNQGPVVCLWYMQDASCRCREVTMKLRRKYGVDRRNNSVHSSNSNAAGDREVTVWLGK
jgi:nucleoside diphosphate kinase